MDEIKLTEPRLPSPTRIADLSDDDRPREKALQNGIRSLSDTELIAILLGMGIQGKSAIDLAREIYQSAGNSLATLAQMSIRDMSRRFSGIGPAKAITIAAALELGGRRKDVRENRQPLIRRAEEAYAVIRDKVENLDHEEFWAILLTRANRVIACERVSSGGTSATVVEPKMVMKLAVDHLASGVIVVHNHPSGNLRPSPQDDTLTQKLKNAGSILDIPVLDHLIVGPQSGFYSYADESRL